MTNKEDHEDQPTGVSLAKDAEQRRGEIAGALPQLGASDDPDEVVEATEMVQASERLRRIASLPVDVQSAAALPDDVQASLEVVDGPAVGVQFPLSRVATAVGRPIDRRGSSAADFRIDDPKVSRQHAVVVYENAEFLVRDAGSANGIALNGEKVITHRLRDGDKLVLGATTLLFRSSRR